MKYRMINFASPDLKGNLIMYFLIKDKINGDLVRMSWSSEREEQWNDLLSWVRTQHATILTLRWAGLHTLHFAGEI